MNARAPDSRQRMAPSVRSRHQVASRRRFVCLRAAARRGRAAKRAPTRKAPSLPLPPSTSAVPPDSTARGGRAGVTRVQLVSCAGRPRGGAGRLSFRSAGVCRWAGASHTAGRDGCRAGECVIKVTLSRARLPLDCLRPAGATCDHVNWPEQLICNQSRTRPDGSFVSRAAVGTIQLARRLPPRPPAPSASDALARQTHRRSHCSSSSAVARARRPPAAPSCGTS